MPIWPKAGQSQAYQRLRRELSGAGTGQKRLRSGYSARAASPIAVGNLMVSQATPPKELAFAEPSHLARPFRAQTTPREFRAQCPG
jgi:hypothetical protein